MESILLVAAVSCPRQKPLISYHVYTKGSFAPLRGDVLTFDLHHVSLEKVTNTPPSLIFAQPAFNTLFYQTRRTAPRPCSGPSLQTPSTAAATLGHTGSLFHIGKSQMNPKMNHTLALPIELINHIFHFLDYKDLLSCTQVHCQF